MSNRVFRFGAPDAPSLPGEGVAGRGRQPPTTHEAARFGCAESPKSWGGLQVFGRLKAYTACYQSQFAATAVRFVGGRCRGRRRSQVHE